MPSLAVLLFFCILHIVVCLCKSFLFFFCFVLFLWTNDWVNFLSIVACQLFFHLFLVSCLYFFFIFHFKTVFTQILTNESHKVNWWVEQYSAYVLRSISQDQISISNEIPFEVHVQQIKKIKWLYITLNTEVVIYIV